ncbi:DEKNAAC101122 [Brettanomyces naardenensis]|uniref:DEKNAAC101122 n=1 Tax=Brettanomyces naardenensis TaxID=13370 RepID=A0A448YH93_BRENA|nr:DEKNAAC101122 [Brettanomyces naardenensis]
MFGCCAVGFFYIVAYHRDWLNFLFLKSLVITISHIYALTLALFLMAHGLIRLPRQTWEESGHYEQRLHNSYLTLPIMREKMEDSKFELTELCSKISTLDNLDPPLQYRDWCLQLVRDIPEEFKPENTQQRYSFSLASEDPLTTGDITHSNLHELSLNLHRLRWKYNHNLITFYQNVQQAIKLEDEVNSKFSGELTYRTKSNGFKSSKVNYTIANYVAPAWGIFFAACLACLTIIVVESEVLHGMKISLIKLVTAYLTATPGDASIMVILTICVPFLTYMLYSALTSLFQVKIFDIYHVESNQSSDPVSTIFFISYACRLTIPLSYNFLMLLDTDFAKDSSFQKFLGSSIKLISLGNFLNDILPRLIVIPMCLTFFRVWEKVKGKLKGNFVFDYFFDEFDFYDDDEDDGDQETGGQGREANLIREAKQIIQQYVDDPTPIRSLQTAPDSDRSGFFDTIGERFSELASHFYTGSEGIGHLRRYNLLSGREGGGISLSGTPSRSSSHSGISLNTNYDADNVILPDEEIQRMDDASDESSIVL